MIPRTETTFLSRFLVLLGFLTIANAVQAKVRVPSIIGENMVIQQGKKVRIWGEATAGERVTVEFHSDTANTVADGQGHWQILIGPYKPGGPFELVIKGQNTLTLKNVLVGEVWVCSGQSNMEWPLVNAKGGAEAVAQANYPEIRLFTVERRTAESPQSDVKGRWVVTTPEQVGQFSAIGYFFGRELHQQLHVPVGLIHTSWGGTPAEAWTSREALASNPELQPILDRYQASLKALPQRQEEYARVLAAWEQQNLYQDAGNKGESMGYADPTFSAADWQKMNLPQYFETAGLKIDGAVWFRKEVDIPEAWSGKDLILNLASIDDFDTTYFNGKKVGATGAETIDSYRVPRRYSIPGSFVHAGRNVIAVRVFDRAGEGGFGPSGEMSIAVTTPDASKPISLLGNWDYKVELGLKAKSPDWGSRPEAPGPNNQNSPSVLYNSMIAPLIPYSIRGAIWYQGESNASRAYQYRVLFPLMIRNWREAWGAGDFPFYFVQLANWRARKTEPTESDWAELREAQTMTLREPQTGMVVIIDIGDENDIHPRNKLDVGHRLAAWALAETYHKNVVPSGPLFASASFTNDKVRIKFKYANGLKTSDGTPPKGFAIAGPDRKFFWADARIDGNAIVVLSPHVPKPVAVRYGWADNPEVNLYNSAHFPASPFRTDDWPGITANRK